MVLAPDGTRQPSDLRISSTWHRPCNETEPGPLNEEANDFRQCFQRPLAALLAREQDDRQGDGDQEERTPISAARKYAVQISTVVVRWPSRWTRVIHMEELPGGMAGSAVCDRWGRYPLADSRTSKTPRREERHRRRPTHGRRKSGTAQIPAAAEGLHRRPRHCDRPVHRDHRPEHPRLDDRTTYLPRLTRPRAPEPQRAPVSARGTTTPGNTPSDGPGTTTFGPTCPRSPNRPGPPRWTRAASHATTRPWWRSPICSNLEGWPPGLPIIVRREPIHPKYARDLKPYESPFSDTP